MRARCVVMVAGCIQMQFITIKLGEEVHQQHEVLDMIRNMPRTSV